MVTSKRYNYVLKANNLMTMERVDGTCSPTIVCSNLALITTAVAVLTTTSTSTSDNRIHQKTFRHGENSVLSVVTMLITVLLIMLTVTGMDLFQAPLMKNQNHVILVNNTMKDVSSPKTLFKDSHGPLNNVHNQTLWLVSNHKTIQVN